MWPGPEPAAMTMLAMPFLPADAPAFLRFRSPPPPPNCGNGQLDYGEEVRAPTECVSVHALR